MSEIAKTLAAKLEVIAELAGKFLLKERGPLAGNIMLASDPSCGGTLAQKMWADAQEDNIGAQSALPGTAPASCDPLADTGEPFTGQSQNQGVSALRSFRATGRQLPCAPFPRKRDGAGLDLIPRKRHGLGWLPCPLKVERRSRENGRGFG